MNQINDKRRTDRSRLEDMIVYMLSKSDYLTEKRLNKLFYCAEIYSIQNYCRRLTIVSFIKYHYGPWSPQIADAGEAIAGRYVQMVGEETPEGHKATFFKLGKEKKDISLSSEETSILSGVAETFGRKKTSEIVKYSKDTFPYNMANFGEIIDLDGYLRSIALICENERVVKAIKESHKQFEEGKFKTFETDEDLEEYYNAL